MPVEGRGLGSRQMSDVARDLEIGQPSNSEGCSEAAEGITRESCGIRAMWIADSGASGSLNPEQADRRFRAQADHFSDLSGMSDPLETESVIRIRIH